MVVCVDTNATLGMFGRAAPLLALRDGLLAGKFRWALSNEILLEYEEVAAREMGAAGMERMLRFIELAGQARDAILRLSPTFRFHVIAADADDNKFADCAIAAEADYIITEDHHFKALAGFRLQAAAGDTGGVHPAAFAGCVSRSPAAETHRWRTN